MGGRVSIVNKTSFTIRIQLCHLSPLYTRELEPNEQWSQETGAVHFTIKVDIVPSPGQLEFGSQVGIVVDGERVVEPGRWKEQQAEKLVHLTSNGWYFKGDNELEIQGGPLLTYRQGGDTVRVNRRRDGEVDLTLKHLKIIRKEKREKKQHSLTPKPPRKASVWRSRSQSISRSVRGSLRGSKETTPDIPNEASSSSMPVAARGRKSPDEVGAAGSSLDRFETTESALDAFFASLPQGAPHIKVQRITK